MVKKELKEKMKAIRCVYRGITNELTAYKVNLKKINMTNNYGKLLKYLHKYNASLYEARTCCRI